MIVWRCVLTCPKSESLTDLKLSLTHGESGTGCIYRTIMYNSSHLTRLLYLHHKLNGEKSW